MKSVSSWVIWFGFTGLLAASALVARTQTWYTPGSPAGYNLGLIGGLLMVALLIYPLKKRVRALQRLGSIKPWFIFHMTCGIVGPMLILFHSTFRIGSQNAMVAMVSMLLVAGSGVIGRYIYVRVHDGLSGHELKLDQLEGDEESETFSFNRDMHWAPDVVAMLMNFRDQTKQLRKGAHGDLVRLVRTPWMSLRVRRQCRKALDVHLDLRAVARHWDREKRVLRGRQFNAMVAHYIATVRRAAQYDTYKRLFSLWHVLHVPFLYLLAASAVYHVIAVHMY